MDNSLQNTEPFVSQFSQVEEQPSSSSNYFWYVLIAIIVIIILTYLYFKIRPMDYFYVNNFLSQIYERIMFVYNYIIYKMQLKNEEVNQKLQKLDERLDEESNINKNIAATQLPAQPIKATLPPPQDISVKTDLHKSLDENINKKQKNMNYNPDDSQKSRVQTSNSKFGWCKIGEYNGVTSCAEVGPNDECMSGQIFPTREICINPNLR